MKYVVVRTTPSQRLTPKHYCFLLLPRPFRVQSRYLPSHSVIVHGLNGGASTNVLHAGKVQQAACSRHQQSSKARLFDEIQNPSVRRMRCQIVPTHHVGTHESPKSLFAAGSLKTTVIPDSSVHGKGPPA
ncbi:hypothetical protein SCLCIDRAFT_700015 [Scleroderma citrinum Foug A]|uniref:Uncharacterized protein n=1 Tax=Scleroderma citrinum Foug A TaxID=1036808 RepID=A0A0C3AWN3_9AGAM|nr:hypothetical protein SCLCIDRAFT_700015 [Scleroderma citrinum Foug A]